MWSYWLNFKLNLEVKSNNVKKNINENVKFWN